MKNIFNFLILILIVLSCSNSDEPQLNLNHPQENNGLNEEDVILEPNIDTSDLSHLPLDTGGLHTAFPLGETNASFGHYIYTPSGYIDDGLEYPLILFLHGWGERGNSRNNPAELDKILNYGPPYLIKTNQWNTSHPFIVASPQLTFEYWNPEQVHNFIEYLVDNYQINTSRIYITGLSLGGGGCWNYIESKKNENYAAAIVPICSRGTISQAESFKNTPVWAFHGDSDQIVDPFTNGGSFPMVKAINGESPKVKAKVTIYKNIGHSDSWVITYNGIGNEFGIRSGTDKLNMSIYDWMLQYKKN